jgi:hypothetical protein
MAFSLSSNVPHRVVFGRRYHLSEPLIQGSHPYGFAASKNVSWGSGLVSFKSYVAKNLGMVVQFPASSVGGT